MNTLVRVESSNANIGARFDTQVQKMFSLYLWYPDVGGVPANPELDPSGTRTTAEFFFFTPPKSVAIDEPYATRVVGTQNGGKFVESHGSIFKNIKVQGTTGFRPRAGLPASIPGPASLVSNVADAINTIGSDSDRIPETEVTGYDDAMFLKNIFRFYSDLKSRGIAIIMIWRDLKDGEEWVVEPKNFRVEKSSTSPLTYNYSLDLNGLAKYSPASIGSLSSFKDPLDASTSFANRITQITNWRNQALRSLLVLSTQINRISGFVSKGTDLLLGSIAKGLKALDAVVVSAEKVPTNVRRIISDALDEIKIAAQDLADHTNSGNQVLLDTTESSLESRRELERLSAVFRGVLVSPFLRDSVASSHTYRASAARSAYKEADIFGSNTLSSPPPSDAPGRSPTPPAVDEGRLLAGETIRDAAARLLGDSSRWHDLVLINNLAAPYTSDSASPEDGVLGPGDPILYPATATGPSIDASSLPTDEDSSILSDSLAARVYGRDLRLTSVTLGAGVAATDLAVNQSGDLSLISGLDNVNQAVLVKFSTEKGELPGYSFFGALATIGSKMDTASFNTFRNSTLATILSDPRISAVQDINFTTNGDVLGVSATLVLSRTSDYLKTNFALRRL